MSSEAADSLFLRRAAPQMWFSGKSWYQFYDIEETYMSAEIPPGLAEADGGAEEETVSAAGEEESSSSELRRALTQWRPLPAAPAPAAQWWGTSDPVSRDALMRTWVYAPGIAPRGTRKTDLSNNIYAFATAATASTWGTPRYGPGPEVVKAATEGAAVIPSDAANQFGRLLTEMASPLGRYAMSFAASADSIRPSGRVTRDSTRSAVQTACKKVRQVLITGDTERDSLFSSESSATEVVDVVEALVNAFAEDPNHDLSDDEAELVSWSLQWALRQFVVGMEDLLIRIEEEPGKVKALGMAQTEIDLTLDELTTWVEYHSVALLPESKSLAEYRAGIARRLMDLIYANPELKATTLGAPYRMSSESDNKAEADDSFGADEDDADGMTSVSGREMSDREKTAAERKKKVSEQKEMDTFYLKYQDKGSLRGEEASEIAVTNAVKRIALRARVGLDISDRDLTRAYLGSYTNASKRSYFDGLHYDNRNWAVPSDSDENPRTEASMSVTDAPAEALPRRFKHGRIESWWDSTVRKNPRNNNHVEWHLVLDAAAARIRNGSYIPTYGGFVVALALEALGKDISLVSDCLVRGPLLTREVYYRYQQDEPHDAIGGTPEDSVYLISQLLRSAFLGIDFDFGLDLNDPDTASYWDDLRTPL